MRWILTAFVVASPLPGLRIAAAEDRPTVVAAWEHRVVGPDSKPARMTLYSNSKINEPNGVNTWSRSGNTLTLRWKSARAPGGVWVDRCTVSPDGRSYSGRNQLGA